MSTSEGKPVAVDRQQNPPAAREMAAQAKKPYRKPVLSKYERVHGIGLGIS
jgi:hypothetical protein